MPYTGTAKNTHSASATVVDSDAVGGTYPGTMTSAFATEDEDEQRADERQVAIGRPDRRSRGSATHVSDDHLEPFCQRDISRPVAAVA
jgi:hypothetical protein